MEIMKNINGKKYNFFINTANPIFKIGECCIYITPSSDGEKYIVNVIDSTYLIDESSYFKYFNVLNDKVEWFVNNEDQAINVAMKLKSIFEHRDTIEGLIEIAYEIETKCDSVENISHEKENSNVD
ncbi:MAG: hypothetical protein [Caudoviricetes sp.]|nr:MAG: hypothetical protein [Caudoviricetes sp.]